MTGAGVGAPVLGRIARVAHALAEREVDVLLVSAPLDVRYVTGFTGSAGIALIAAEGAGARAPDPNAPHRFITDFRYRTQSAEQLPGTFQREIVTGNLLDGVGAALGPDGGHLGFDESQLTVSDHARLREQLASEWELVPCAEVVGRLRAVKDADELARIRAACELADDAMRTLLEDGIVGRSERDVAIELELRMRRLGASAPSFPTIVATGAHGALPHATPRATPIPRDALVLIDWGALHEGYCSDCTRTYATGEGISAQAREIYELVRSAQEAGLAAARAGPSGREVDAAARAVIEAGGEGAHFGHGLGHGVGLDIHEPPRLSRTAPDEPLLAGNVVTIEPGVYLPGRLGVRIEDLVAITADGHEVFTGLPKALTVID